MSLVIGGQHGVAILVTYSGRVLRVWAERGLVHMEDSRDNSYVVKSVKDALFHLNGINEMIGNTIVTGSLQYKDEIALHQKFIQDCTAVLQKAREQGMPTDSSAVRDNNRRRATTLTVPAMDF